MAIFLCVVIYLLIGIILDLVLNAEFTLWTLGVMLFWPVPVLAGAVSLIFKR